MIITERTASDAELDKVLDIIRKGALSPEGRAAISIDKLSKDKDIINKRAERIALYISLLGGEAPDVFPPVEDLFEYADETHADFSGEDIHRAGEFLHSYISMLHFLRKDEDIHEEDRILSEDILSSLDSEGNVREDHPRLLPLIKKRDEIRNERMRFSASFISSHRASVQQSEPLYRNERVVIPIRSDQKSTIDCFVSGSSSSGNTLFAEPFELVALNNEAVIAEECIRLEKLRIIHDLSERIRFLMPVMRKMLEEVIDFDFHYAFALWAKREKAVHPEIGKNLRLCRARHPLLGANAVPIDISIPENVNAIVLSGANAGGKTVTMKTVMLLSLLNQLCGYITASDGSVLPLFSTFFSDIGDNQSILDAASTFSSHMKNIASIARKADKSSLVILDELGSGTDPGEGAALSRAILSYFSDHAALTLVTSHYPEVKSYAYSDERMMNASMEFDEKSGLPTYRVLEGIPGDSHAIITAKRSGMPREITDMAASSLQGGEESAGRIIRALISKERTLDRKITESQILKRKLEKLEKDINERESKLNALENELRKDGIREINEYLRESRRNLEKLVMEVKTGTLTKEKTRKVKAFADSIEKKIEEEEDLLDEEEAIPDDSPLSSGDEVECGKAKTPGKVISVNKDRILVLLDNGLKLTLPRAMVWKRLAKKNDKGTFQFSSSAKKAQYTMDVRGLTLQETIERLDDQMEAALLDGLSSFSIIHGYGDGILSKGVHDYLRKRREVKDYRFALPEDGGMGKTYVELF